MLLLLSQKYEKINSFWFAFQSMSACLSNTPHTLCELYKSPYIFLFQLLAGHKHVWFSEILLMSSHWICLEK